MGAAYKYKKEFCTLLVAHMSEGLSFDSFAAIAKVTPKCLYDWEARYEEFAEAKELGTAASLLYWEKLGRAACDGSHDKEFKFNPAVWIFTLKCRFKRFGYQDLAPEEIADKRDKTAQIRQLMLHMEQLAEERANWLRNSSIVSQPVQQPSGLLGEPCAPESKPSKSD